MSPGNQLSPIRTGNRAFVFGGSYSNLHATQAVLEKAAALGFSPHQIIFTGDIVAYCGQPQETTNLIRNSGVHVIMGNCEESIGEGSENCGCGFAEGSTCNLLSVEWYQFCQSHLDIDTKIWMSLLPKTMYFEIGDFVLQSLHATPKAINEFVFPSDLSDGNFKLESNSQIDGYIVGHSGIPFVKEINSMAWINSGSAGMPANDGTSRVWYATIEAAENKLIAETHSLDYNHTAAAATMKQAGLKNGYSDCLVSGIWPSHDVLPGQEQLQTGQPLQSERIVLSKGENSAFSQISEEIKSVGL